MQVAPARIAAFVAAALAAASGSLTLVAPAAHAAEPAYRCDQVDWAPLYDDEDEGDVKEVGVTATGTGNCVALNGAPTKGDDPDNPNHVEGNFVIKDKSGMKDDLECEAAELSLPEKVVAVCQNPM